MGDTDDKRHVGLIPVMLGFYDRLAPKLRAELEAFVDQVADALRSDGITLTTSRIPERQSCPGSSEWRSLSIGLSTIRWRGGWCVGS